jgi:hypothetical protein
MKKLLTPLFVLAYLGGGVLLRASAGTDYDQSINFANHETNSRIKVKASDQLWENCIEHDVDAKLVKKGWQEVPSGGDAAASVFESTHTTPTIETFYDGFSGGWL